MFAIIQTGGRQVKVGPDSVVTVDRVEAEVGKEITFDQVLFLEKDGGEMLAGAPFIANVKVVGIVEGESRGPKIRVFKKKRRKGFRKTRGHRSTYTVIRVTDIVSRNRQALQWLQKKGREVPVTAATATRSGSASSVTTATW